MFNGISERTSSKEERGEIKMKSKFFLILLSTLFLICLLAFSSADTYNYDQYGQEITNHIEVDGQADITIHSYFSDWVNTLAINSIAGGLGGWTAEGTTIALFRQVACSYTGLGSFEHFKYHGVWICPAGLNKQGTELRILTDFIIMNSLSPFFTDYEKLKNKIEIIEDNLLNIKNQPTQSIESELRKDFEYYKTKNDKRLDTNEANLEKLRSDILKVAGILISAMIIMTIIIIYLIAKVKILEKKRRKK